MNPAEAAQFVKTIDGTYPVPQLAGVHGRMRFIGPLATRDVIIDDGKVTITPDEGKVDCTVTAYEPLDNVRLIRGELQLVTSLLQGRIEAEGDPMLLIRIAGSFREFGQGLPLPSGPQPTKH